jgi:hypothetical protein
MTLDTTDRPSIEERYETACSASTLKVNAERGGPADMLIAAGWSEHQTGMALLRLHSEYQGAAKPKRLGPAQIATLAVQHRDKEGRPNRQKAQAEAARWYANELRLLAISLKSRPAVWAQLLPWSQAKGIPQEQVAQALFHFLDPVCSHCGGHGLHKAKDAPALSAKQCRVCNGTGTKAIPEGGGRVLSYISHCTSQARQSISKRLRPNG